MKRRMVPDIPYDCGCKNAGSHFCVCFLVTGNRLNSDVLVFHCEIFSKRWRMNENVCERERGSLAA